MSDSLIEKVRLAMEAKYLPFVNVPAEDMDAAIEAAIAIVAEEAAKVAKGTVYKEHYRTWDYMKFDGGQGNVHETTELAKHSDELASDIRALATHSGDGEGKE